MSSIMNTIQKMLFTYGIFGGNVAIQRNFQQFFWRKIYLTSDEKIRQSVCQKKPYFIQTLTFVSHFTYFIL